MPAPRRTDPRRPEPDDTTPYGFGADDAPAPPRPAPPEPPHDPSAGEGPKSQKPPRPADYRKVKVDPRHVDKLLQTKPKPRKGGWPELPWWALPEAFALVGVLLGAVPVTQAIGKLKAGPTTAAFIAIVILVAVLVQTALSAAALSAVGGWFSVDYGPPRRAAAKLAGLSVFATGLVIALLSVGGPLAALFAAVPALAAFAALFRLNGIESLVSAAALGFASVGTALVVFVGAVLYFR